MKKQKKMDPAQRRAYEVECDDIDVEQNDSFTDDQEDSDKIIKLNKNVSKFA